MRLPLSQCMCNILASLAYSMAIYLPCEHDESHGQFICTCTTNDCIINFHLAGLFLSLRGTPIDDNGFVDVDDIGNSLNPDNRLLCHTNDTNCCTGAQGTTSGAWFFPDGTILPTVSSIKFGGGSGTGFGRDRGQSVTRLHRYNNPSERGRFRCDLLGDTIYANICE